ncbi:hypothetical protein NQ314_008442 [Rhamnusium bicolor]|uniref:Regulatory protein zeste n=1 Tax=Rhamnusium bicolor TaxID=1586634 RepID=A0AAV8YBC5_9CUCU|nr:hypothetical protein NQ314_008442 [Rhamnusium bicolor]
MNEENFNKILGILDNPLALLDAGAIDCGVTFLEYFVSNKVPNDIMYEIQTRCKNFLLTLAKELAERIPNNESYFVQRTVRTEMDVEVSKRSRNFTDYDRNLLFELVIQYKHILENKKTDGTSVKQKNEAWDEITLKYNSSCQTGPRNAKQLHALYDGIKKKARKNLHDDKKNLFKTGGGTFTPQSDELDLKIATILKPQYQALTNCFDSSAAYFQGKLLLLRWLTI